MLDLVLLQAAENPQQGGGWNFWIMMILIFVVLYFFMIRPQTKKQKELQKQRDAMKKGDKVITAGGIYGEIKEVQDNAFIITIAKDITIKVDKGSVYASADDAQAQQAQKTETK
ncbi:MAG: preprotein translocase subunit YajC [Bacteroidales bacterium]|nr:preprotein translocase subunit YajC [Candidatus Colicola coprequi]